MAEADAPPPADHTRQASQRSKPERKRWSWRKRIIVAIIGLSLIGLILQPVASIVARSLAQSYLDELFTSDARYASLDVNIFTGSVVLTGLEVPGPDPAEPSVLRIERLEGDLLLPGLLTGSVILQRAAVHGMQIHAQHESNGAFNFCAVLSAAAWQDLIGPPEPDDGDDFRLSVWDLAISDLSVRLVDDRFAPAWELALDDLDLQAEDLILGGEQRISVAHLHCGWQSCRVSQLPAFFRGELFSTGRLDLHLRAEQGLAGPVAIDELQLGGVRLAIERQPSGAGGINSTFRHLTALVEAAEERLLSIVQGPVPAAEHAVSTADAVTEASAQRGLPELRLGTIAIDCQQVYLRDHYTLHGETMDVLLEALRIRVDDCVLFSDTAPSERGLIQVAAAIVQQLRTAPGAADDEEQGDRLPSALLQVDVHLDHLPPLPAWPSATVSTVLTGFIMDTVDGFIPTGAQAALGAPALDSCSYARVEPDRLYVIGLVDTSAGIAYPFFIGGSPAEPSLNLGPVLTGAVNRVGRGVWNLGTGAVDMSVELAGAGVNAIGKVSKGALDVTTEVGSGLWNITKGIVTLDPGKVVDGAGQSTVGAVNEGAGTVGETTADLGKDSIASTAAIGQADAFGRWLASIAQRHAPQIVHMRDAASLAAFETTAQGRPVRPRRIKRLLHAHVDVGPDETGDDVEPDDD